MRSTFYTVKGNDPNVKSINLKKNRSVLSNKNKILGSKLYVSGSQRMDLSKPYNFHPGPGSYFLDKIDKDAELLYDETTQRVNL
jgi:hypothetical protein